MSKNNEVRLIGNIGKDPIVRETGKGTKITSFSLATTEYKKVGDEYEPYTDWHNINSFGKIAEELAVLKKGTYLLIFGVLKTRSWEDNGNKRYITEVIVNSYHCLKKKENKGGYNPSKPVTTIPVKNVIEETSDDLPF